MRETNGRKPREDGPWMVRFRGGVISGPFKTDQLRWTDTGDSFDVLAIERADKKKDPARSANGAYQ